VVLAGNVKEMEVVPIPVPLREINCAAAETFRLLSVNSSDLESNPSTAGVKSSA